VTPESPGAPRLRRVSVRRISVAVGEEFDLNYLSLPPRGGPEEVRRGWLLAFLDWNERVWEEAVSLAVHGDRGFSVGRLDEAEHLP
jgi:hypothetical protein